MSNRNSITQELKAQITILGGMVGIFWFLEILDQYILRRTLDLFGIIPRTVIGLRGILFAPFLHGDFAHLIANTIPFLVLGWLVMLRETSDFIIVTIVTTIVGGMGVWLFAAPGSLHIGASGLIFGYLGFLLFRGWFQRDIFSIVLSIVVFLLYGGMIWGVLPASPMISWQGHLFGFIGGAIAARLIAKEKRFSS